MAEIEYGGIKIGGSKLLLIVPLLGTIIGGLWGGFELYSRYLQTEEKIQQYVAPDLSGFDKKLALIESETNAKVEILIQKDCPIKNIKLNELTKKFPDLEANILGVIRNNKFIILLIICHLFNF